MAAPDGPGHDGAMTDSYGPHQGGTDPHGVSGSATTPPPGEDRPHLNPPHQSQPHRGFFDQIRALGVQRSSDRWIAGVCAGVARRFNVDPLLVRAAMVAALFLGIGFLAYLVAWALLPDQDGTILAEKAVREGDAWGIVLLVVIALALFGSGPWFSDSGWVGGLVVVGAVATAWWYTTQRKGQSTSRTAPPPPSGQTFPTPTTGATTDPQSQARPQPVWAPGGPAVGYEPPPAGERTHASSYAEGTSTSAPPRPKAKGAGLAGFLLVLGATVLGYGLGMSLSDPLGGPATVISLLFATAAAGLGTIVLGLLGRRSVLSGLLSILLAISLVASWGIGIVPQGGFGEKQWTPSATSVAPEYSWGMGSATLDLRELTAAPEQGETTATVSFGEFVIYVPEDVTTRVLSSAHFGSVEVIGAEGDSLQVESGTNLGSEFLFGTDDPAEAELTINANVRFGSLKIMTPSEPANR